MFSVTRKRYSLIAVFFFFLCIHLDAQFPEGFETVSSINCTAQTGNSYLGSTSCLPFLWSTSLDKPFVTRSKFNYSGSRCLTVAGGITAYVETKKVSLTKDVTYNLSFYFRTSCKWGGCSSGITVHAGALSYANSGEYMNVGNMTLIFSNKIDNDYKQYFFAFTPNVTGDYVFQLRATSLTNGSAQEYGHFDDFNLTTNPPMPIQLTDFKGNCINNIKKITWSTESERNNKVFVLEKWQKNAWQFFKEIEGKRNSNVLQEYEVLDDDSEEESYYLLSQIDYDGTKETFSPISVKCKQKSQVAIFPNPSSDVLYIQEISAENNIKIIHSSGKVMQTIENYLPVQSIDISALSGGIYVLLIQHNGWIESFKWMKM